MYDVIQLHDDKFSKLHESYNNIEFLNQYKSELDQKIIETINFLKQDEKETTIKKYIFNMEQSYCQTINHTYASTLISCFLLQNMLDTLMEIKNKKHDAINLYAKYCHFYEQIKSLATLKIKDHDPEIHIEKKQKFINKVTSSLHKELFSKSDTTSYYCTYSMNAIPCLIKAIMSLSKKKTNHIHKRYLFRDKKFLADYEQKYICYAY